MLSNKQIFDGWVFPVPELGYPMNTGHTFYTTLTLCQTTPLLLIFLGVVMIIVLQEYMPATLVKFGFKSENPQPKVVQCLPKL
jgi:hypothetical protein